MEGKSDHPTWQEYKVLRVLGKGAQGTVREAIHLPSGRRVAIKTIRKDGADARAAVEAEAGALQGIRHPHIITLLEPVFETKRSFALVFELAEGGTLLERIVKMKSFTEEDAAVCLATVLNALVFLHDSRGICHRDLKTPNLQFQTKDKDAPLLILDFGIAKSFDPRKDAMKTQIGSPLFMAPEILAGRGYGKAVDLFSMGVIAYQCLCGLHPAHGYEDQADLFRKIMSGDFDYSDETWDGISDEGRDFCRRLMEGDPTKRMTAAEAMQHPWITKFCPASYLADLKQVNIEAEEDSDPVPGMVPKTSAVPLANPSATQSDSMLSVARPIPKRTRTVDNMPGVLSVSSHFELPDRKMSLPNLLDDGPRRSRFRSVFNLFGIASYFSRNTNDSSRLRSKSENEVSVREAQSKALSGETNRVRAQLPFTRLTTIPASPTSAISPDGKLEPLDMNGLATSRSRSPSPSPPTFPPSSELNLVDWDVDDDVEETKAEELVPPTSAPKKPIYVEVNDERSVEDVIADAFGY